MPQSPSTSSRSQHPVEAAFESSKISAHQGDTAGGGGDSSGAHNLQHYASSDKTIPSSFQNAGRGAPEGQPEVEKASACNPTVDGAVYGARCRFPVGAQSSAGAMRGCNGVRALRHTLDEFAAAAASESVAGEEGVGAAASHWPVDARSAVNDQSKAAGVGSDGADAVCVPPTATSSVWCDTIAFAAATLARSANSAPQFHSPSLMPPIAATDAPASASIATPAASPHAPSYALPLPALQRQMQESLLASAAIEQQRQRQQFLAQVCPPHKPPPSSPS